LQKEIEDREKLKEEKDREIAELKARLQALEAQGANISKPPSSASPAQSQPKS